MTTMSIALPPIEAEKAVEVLVRVNGNTRTLNYRVEHFRWEDWWVPPEPRAESIKRILAAYDRRWQLLQIGTPDETGIPIMFRQLR